MHINNLLHGFSIGKFEVEETSSQECIWQFFSLLEVMITIGRCFALIVSPNSDKKLHAIDFLQQIVWKFDICFVDLVDQQHHAPQIRRPPKACLSLYSCGYRSPDHRPTGSLATEIPRRTRIARLPPMVVDNVPFQQRHPQRLSHFYR